MFAGCNNLSYLTFRSQYGAFDSEPRPDFYLQTLPLLPSLNRLEIRRRSLSKSDLRSIATNCPSMTMLELSECHLEANALIELSTLKSLEQFLLRDSNLGDEVVAWAGQMPNLRMVKVDGTKMTAEGRDALRRLRTARNQPDVLERIGESYLDSPLLRTKDGRPPVVRN